MRHAGGKLLGAAATGLAAVLPVEWKLAKRGPQLIGGPPFEHDGCVGHGDGAPLRIVWLGDSTADGAGASSADAAMPRRVAAGLGRPVDLTVIAVSGSRVADVLEKQVGQVAALEPDVVIVSVTTNDVLYRTPWPDVQRDYLAVLRALPAGTLGVALGPADMGATARLLQPLRFAVGLWGRRTNAQVRAAAREAGALFVDLVAATGGPMRHDPDGLLADDRFHASDAGHQLFADAVVAVLHPALDRRVRQVQP